MIGPPKTLAEARKYVYGHGLHGKRPYVEGRCAFEVWPNDRAPNPYQCLRANGHGPERLYCRQHDPAAAKKRKEKSYERYRRMENAATRPERTRDLYAKALRKIARIDAGNSAATLRDIARDALAKAKKL